MIKNMNKNKDTYIAVSVFIGLVVIFSIIFTVVQNNKKEQKQSELKNNFEMCGRKAYDNYSTDFKGECVARGLKETCQLPLVIANSLEERMKEQENRCFDTYKLEVGLIK